MTTVRHSKAVKLVDLLRRQIFSCLESLEDKQINGNTAFLFLILPI